MSQETWRVCVHKPCGFVKVETRDRVVFDGFKDRIQDAQLASAAPDMLRALKRLRLAAVQREHHMGDPYALLDAKAELEAAASEAMVAITKAEYKP
jgi:hypothetical protein